MFRFTPAAEHDRGRLDRCPVSKRKNRMPARGKKPSDIFVEDFSESDPR